MLREAEKAFVNCVKLVDEHEDYNVRLYDGYSAGLQPLSEFVRI